MELRKDSNGDHYIVSDSGRVYTIELLKGTSGKTTSDKLVIMFVPVNEEDPIEMGIAWWQFGVPEDFDNLDEETLSLWKTKIEMYEGTNRKYELDGELVTTF